MTTLVQSPEAKQDLAKKVIERQKFIEEVIDFVGALLFKQGKVLKREVHDYYTYSETELKDFEGLSFFHKGPGSMFGGEQAVVQYRDKVVLSVEWWNIAECKVEIFDESSDWQERIRRLAKDKKEIIERREQEEAERKLREKLAAQEREAVQGVVRRLDEHTKRLKIT
jgi:hypothetical protein